MRIPLKAAEKFNRCCRRAAWFYLVTTIAIFLHIGDYSTGLTLALGLWLFFRFIGRTMLRLAERQNRGL